MPLEPTTPAFIQSFQTAFNTGLNKVAEESMKGIREMSSTAIIDPSLVQKYASQKGFDPLHFNPYSSLNNERWAAKETWGTALEKGFDGFKTKFGNTFVDYWKDYGRMADALISFDMKKMLPSETEMMEQYYKDQQDMIKNHVFVPAGQEDRIFGKGGVSELISNAGFAMGTTAAFSLEILADAAITALTSGIGSGSFAATFARFGTKEAVEQGAKIAAKQGAKEITEKVVKKSFVTNFIEGIGFRSTDDIIRSSTKAAELDNLAAYSVAGMGKKYVRPAVGEAIDIMSFNIKNIVKSKSFGEFALNVGKGVPVLGSGVRAAEKMVVASKSGYGIATHLGIGFNGLRRMANEYNMSSTEATFEGISTYGDTLDYLVNDFVKKNGRGPSDTELSSLQSNASKAAFGNYQTNMAILLASNKIQFGALFNKLPMHRVWIKDLFSESVEGVLAVETKTGAKVLSTKGFTGGIKALRTIAKESGKRKALWEGAKMFRKDFLKFEVVEGLQEVIQETSNLGWANYYKQEFDDASYTLADTFKEGAKEQWSPKGLKVFVHGALTGSLIRIPTMTLSAAMTASQRGIYDVQYGKENNPMRQAETQQQKDITFVNGLIADYKTSKVNNIVESIQNSIEMTDAAENDDAYRWNNARDKQVIQGVLAANRLGINTAYVKSIEHMADDMTTEEFNKIFNIDLSRTKYKTPQEFVKDIARDVENYSDKIDAVRDHFKDKMIDPSIYTQGSSKQQVAKIARNKQEEAIQLIALNVLKGDRNVERVKKMSEELSKIEGMDTSSLYALNTLTDLESLNSEIGNLMGDVRSIKESISLAETESEKKELLAKQTLIEERIQDLTKWKSYWTNGSKGISPEFVGEVISEEEGNVVTDSNSKNIKELFRKIINNKNKEEGKKEITEEAFQESSPKMIDIIKLSQDSRLLIDSYQSLYNPEVYSSMVQKMTEGQIKFIIITALEESETILKENAYNVLVKVGSDQKFSEDWSNKTEKFLEDLNNMIMSDPIYKDLQQRVSNPDAVLKDLENFEQELRKLDDRLTVIFETWKLHFNEGVIKGLSTEDIEMMKTSNMISNDAMTVIAYKKINSIQLHETEESAYKVPEIKKSIDSKIKDLQDFKVPDISKESVKDPEEKDVSPEEVAPETISEIEQQPIEKIEPKEIETPAEPVKSLEDRNYEFAKNIVLFELNELFDSSIASTSILNPLLSWLKKNYSNKDWNKVFQNINSKKALKRQINKIIAAITEKELEDNVDIVELPDVNVQGNPSDPTGKAENFNDKVDIPIEDFKEVLKNFEEKLDNISNISEKNTTFAKEDLVSMLNKIKCKI